jgi:hypothetical protein
MLCHSSTSASHPVGTTFRIQGFLQALPVRKDVAKKAAPKILTSIKKLLYSYAYARPSVRYAFKVLRANNERGNWSYAPKLGSTSLQDTATKIAGQEVAAQCEVRSAASQQTVPQSAAVEFYSVDAVLVKTDAGMLSVLCVLALSYLSCRSFQGPQHRTLCIRRWPPCQPNTRGDKEYCETLQIILSSCLL